MEYFYIGNRKSKFTEKIQYVIPAHYNTFIHLVSGIVFYTEFRRTHTYSIIGCNTFDIVAHRKDG